MASNTTIPVFDHNVGSQEFSLVLTDHNLMSFLMITNVKMYCVMQHICKITAVAFVSEIYFRNK
jgi:hypothetical protein